MQEWLVGTTPDGAPVHTLVDHPPASGFAHIHGWCPECKGYRASADIRDGSAWCSRCGTELLEASLHDPHGPIEDVHVGVPE